MSIAKYVDRLLVGNIVREDNSLIFCIFLCYFLYKQKICWKKEKYVDNLGTKTSAPMGAWNS